MAAAGSGGGCGGPRRATCLSPYRCRLGGSPASQARPLTGARRRSPGTTAGNGCPGKARQPGTWLRPPSGRLDPEIALGFPTTDSVPLKLLAATTRGGHAEPGGSLLVSSGRCCSPREEGAGEGIWCYTGKVPAKTSSNSCQGIASQGDIQALSAVWLFHTEEPAAQAAGATKLLNSPLLVFAVSAYFSACSRNRIQELAQPKKVSPANDPRLVWGNQETIRTLSLGARTAQPSPRTVALAKPKQDFGKHKCRSLFLYGCGRESTIWERPLLEDFSFPSDRLLKLSEPKKCQDAYLQRRPRQSPEWRVSPAALSYKATPRVLELAQPKVLQPDFLLAREVPTSVSKAAASARASPQLQLLAEPCLRKVTWCYDNSVLEAAIRPVSKSALRATASPWILELARAKSLHPDYLPLRDAEWPVTKAAKHSVATPRLVELAQPCKRLPMDLTQFDPDAFTVSEAAKKATCSARIQELARPVKR
ncbi:sperm microtubule associated protein 2-like [Colius striatus]|uniref:sperm microtubule associated protein 2-like n=1 Tax=Colius striatus TaxID=57412 RepID=UPI002B1D9A07|nr:sperm microtubule associated protein 2-like [Colius striatus]